MAAKISPTEMPIEQKEVLQKAYKCFNDRDIDGVLRLLHHEVDWPNGMEGGIEHGHEAVRNYWTRQWKLVNPRVDPEDFKVVRGDRVDVTVHQLVKNLNGEVLLDQIVHHVYRFRDGLIIAMEIVNPS